MVGPQRGKNTFNFYFRKISKISFQQRREYLFETLQLDNIDDGFASEDLEEEQDDVISDFEPNDSDDDMFIKKKKRKRKPKKRKRTSTLFYYSVFREAREGC